MWRIYFLGRQEHQYGFAKNLLNGWGSCVLETVTTTTNTEIKRTQFSSGDLLFNKKQKKTFVSITVVLLYSTFSVKIYI